MSELQAQVDLKAVDAYNDRNTGLAFRLNCAGQESELQCLLRGRWAELHSLGEAASLSTRLGPNTARIPVCRTGGGFFVDQREESQRRLYYSLRLFLCNLAAEVQEFIGCLPEMTTVCCAIGE
jgi:hypothetical protein